MRLKKRKECLFFLLFAFLIFGIFQYSIHKIFGMVYFPDEFGYWASAAKWNGYDWSSLTALGSYYPEFPGKSGSTLTGGPTATP